MEFVPGDSLFKCLPSLVASASTSASALMPATLSTAASAPAALSIVASAPAALPVLGGKGSSGALPAVDQAPGFVGGGGSSGAKHLGSSGSGAGSGGSSSSGGGSSSGGSSGVGSLLVATAEDLGRLFTLDMLLGNADRLPCSELGWRGNPGVRGVVLLQDYCLAACFWVGYGWQPSVHRHLASLPGASCGPMQRINVRCFVVTGLVLFPLLVACAAQAMCCLPRAVAGRGGQWLLMQWCSGARLAA